MRETPDNDDGERDRRSREDLSNPAETVVAHSRPADLLFAQRHAPRRDFVGPDRGERLFLVPFSL